MTVITSIRVPYQELRAFIAQVFIAHQMPAGPATAAAEALCYGDLTGLHSHGLVNLTRRAVRHHMIGIVAANCGRQRIARPPGGRLAMLGTNPLSIAAPAGENHPFVLDMSCGSGQYKGFGLGLMVEVLAALVPGAGLGPGADALAGNGGPSGRDDDIGFLVVAIAPGLLRPGEALRRDAQELFGALLACPPVCEGAPVRYPGWLEAERARVSQREGVPLTDALYAELRGLAGTLALRMPDPIGAC